MAEELDGCVTPAGGPVDSSEKSQKDEHSERKEVPMEIAKVGKPAPDFQLSGYHAGGFKNFKLSDYKGKWIVVCFYPGDFTFV